MNNAPVFKDLVLIGGGHSHALVLRQWAMMPLPGVRITLISPQVMTPYSGMLPGLLAGHYSFRQTHIDLQKLALWAGVRYIKDQAVHIDPVNNRITLKNHPVIEFDVASVDIGSTPNQLIPGAAAFSTPVKPIARFYAQWQTIQKKIRQHAINSIAVVGGGAGSVEVILAMAWRTLQLRDKPLHFHLLCAADDILPNYHPRVRTRAKQQLEKYGIQIHPHFRVTEVKSGQLHGSNGQSLNADEIIWCTQASGAEWLKKTALDPEKSGFIPVRPTLQSLNFEHIFAAGDIAHIVKTPCPKAGVYAVRQAPVLFNNLRAVLLKQPLKKYHPQRDFLSLLALGEKTAVGSKYFLSFSGDWVWRWKDYIDRKFMRQFHSLPDLSMPAESLIPPVLIDEVEKNQTHSAEQRCNGCGAKIGAKLLQDSLETVLGPGCYQPQDAVQINVAGQTVYQNVDVLKSLIDDPWLFGRIAINHALSDLYAMNLKPDSVQLMLTLPHAGQSIQRRELTMLMQGIVDQLEIHQCRLLGGHSAEARELSIGVVANGLPQARLFNKSGLQSGDKLVLSKPLGIGVILAAAMQNRCDGSVYQHAISKMLQSNQAAAQTLSNLNVVACTDVTGFGLYGHLLEMCLASNCRARIDLHHIPTLTGAKTLAEQQIRSSLYPQNLALSSVPVWPEALRQKPVFDLLFDPQTSGGLLAAIPDTNYPAQDTPFHQQFYTIGEVLPRADHSASILIATR